MMKRVKRLVVLMFVFAAVTLGFARNSFAETKDDATPIIWGEKYSYTHFYDEQRFFEFRVTKSGYFNFNLTKAEDGIEIDLLSSKDDYGHALFYDLNYNEKTGYYTGNVTVPILAGTYYIRIKDDFFRGSHEAEVSFEASFTSSYESFGETYNKTYDTIKTAKEISLGTSYKGFFTGYTDTFFSDNKDMYKIVLDTDATYRFSVNRKNADDILYLTFMDNEGKQIDKYKFNGDTLSDHKDLNIKKGTYYLKFSVSNLEGVRYGFKVSQVAPTIATQPKDAAVYLGSTAKFTVKSDSYGVKYQWQLSTDGGKTWKTSNVSGNKTESISVKAAENKEGYKYRCKVYVGSKYKYSKAVTLNIKPKITLQPKSVSVKNGSKATFTVDATGVNLTYQWQVSSNGGKTWSNTSSTGNKTKKITVEANQNKNGRMYRCVVSNGSIKTNSDAATLTVK